MQIVAVEAATIGESDQKKEAWPSKSGGSAAG
jgi:hypothetical protein